MASRESQGLQVALILFVMVTVVLGVTTYVYFRKAEEKIKERDSARAQAQQSEQYARNLDFKLQLLKHLVGYETKSEQELDGIKQSLAAEQDVKDILAAFDEDVATFGNGQDKATVNWRTLPGNLIATIRKLNDQYTEANRDLAQLREERDKIRLAEEAKVVQAENASKKTMDDLVAERKDWKQSLTRVQDEKNRIAVLLPEKNETIQRITAEKQTNEEILNKQLQTVTQLYEALKVKQMAEEETTYERPDGEIKWVNQRSNLVAVNLGSADGVQRQMTFSVIDQRETGVTKGKVKGRIEVTRVMEDHLCEARIVEDVLADPILQGDIVYSPTFKKGHKTRFALTGFIDIDGDGKSDLRKAKSIITMNGGVIDAELLEDGTVAGKMTVNTRFLVQGERPTERTNPDLRDGHTELTSQAGSLGVETISLENLLDRMGYYKDQTVVPLQGGGTGGSGGQNSNFRPRSAYDR